MTVSQAQAFLSAYAPDAQVAAARTGLPWQTILAQWADETGYGTAPAFTQGHNFAGISPGGSVASYPDQTSGLAAYIATINQPIYATVRNAAAQGPVAAAEALGASPWAGSHYDANNSGVPGADLVTILDSGGLVAGATAQLTSTWDTIKNGISAIVPGFGPGGSVVGGIGDIAGGAAGGAAGDIASSVVADLIGAIKKPAIMAVALTAAGALVIGGIWKAVQPEVAPVVDSARQKAGQAAQVAMLA